MTKTTNISNFNKYFFKGKVITKCDVNLFMVNVEERK